MRGQTPLTAAQLVIGEPACRDAGEGGDGADPGARVPDRGEAVVVGPVVGGLGGAADDLDAVAVGVAIGAMPRGVLRLHALDNLVGVDHDVRGDLAGPLREPARGDVPRTALDLGGFR
jgi:hypothetical protein